MERLALSLVVLGLLASSGAAAATTLHQYGSSAPLRTLAQSPLARDPVEPLRRIVPLTQDVPRAAIAPQFALPSGPGAPALPQVRTGGRRFHVDGLRAADGSVSGALGDLQYVQVANGLMAVYRKADGAYLLGPVAASAMFIDAPPGPATEACGAQRGGDAAVHFDQLANRWIVSYRSWGQGRAAIGPYYQCIAMSAGSDAGGSYQRYALEMQAASGRTLYFDDPQLAVWPDAYYFSVNLFDSVTGRYRGPRICGIERQALLRGTDAALRCRDLGDKVAPLAPASLEGDAGAPRGASPALFLALEFSGAGRGAHLLLWRFAVSANKLAAPLAIAVAPFTIACPDGSACVDQPAPGAGLAALGERLLPRPVYRNDDGRDALLAAHSVQMADGRVGLRWYEIREPFGAARAYQQGDVAPGTTSRWMGSINGDKAGNIALGYSVASSDTPPGIAYTGRLRSDPPGRMQAEEIIFNGNGVQSDQARTMRAAGALALDPIDGCTFWYTQRYLPSTGPANWRTRIASFKFEGCQ